MKKSLSVLIALAASLIARGEEFKHAVATVELSGTWKMDGESSEDTLILNSKPDGHQIVVSALRLKKEPRDMDELMGIAVQIYQKRMAAFMVLSKDTAEFDRPATEATETSVLCSAGHIRRMMGHVCWCALRQTPRRELFVRPQSTTTRV